MSYKSSEGRETGKLTNVFRSVKTVLGQRIGQSASIKAISASGGTETTVVGSDGNTYKVHTFTTVGSSTFTISSNDPSASYFLQIQSGGGGSGGPQDNGADNISGGGGGSGSLGIYLIPTTPGSYTVTVGDGGAGGAGGGAGGNGTPGSQSSFINAPFITITHSGGGGGTASAGPTAGGGAGGSISSFTPGTNKQNLIVASVPGSPGFKNAPAGGAGGNISPAIILNPYNLFYTSPDSLSAKGSGGTAGYTGNPGNAGYVRIFYQIPA